MNLVNMCKCWMVVITLAVVYGAITSYFGATGILFQLIGLVIGIVSMLLAIHRWDIFK